MAVRSYGPNRVLGMCDLDIRDITLCQDHDTPLGNGQQLCEILSRSDKWVQSYDKDKM